ncbi:truB [Wigglesworthia glossinidia endosymbiont of Glossina brevipalpis]|uniref:tRNA pseudouridine synthase B n=1 Tax=Wigglesworthia glossinidia brevipalpis TaxID=36870 RepID=TRUB_WIGBR|nr:RecName: Full=tRNA pseudouridine synthase B; AltName: Full=tRNA pseudouridine(55) synthase; Short=Psi55 synthase; AltName: Full=tRNA pseudouridylate synthase; AltName: Full=tRNA-uridine isomerase [Wigglesworthia glossinidia endosymbiont of Glossina brevipalpis]BAC24370.1 truB [Wigglesworthia glossinidia endosymbiont of Glossina brevipalpis]
MIYLIIILLKFQKNLYDLLYSVIIKEDYLRNINGILLLDKPIGLSSNLILQKIKKLFKAKKAGYIGTLDPIASGMLPIFFGDATKFSDYLLNTNKWYKIKAKLGEKTNTLDSFGKIICIRPILNIKKLNIEKILSEFQGEIYQKPPMFSSLKHLGKPLYKYARQGIYIPREKRKVYVHYIKLLSFSKKYFSLTIKCSKGTYVRSIVDDIGEKLFCGAHIVKLRRTKLFNYKESHMIDSNKLYNIKKKFNDLKKLDECLLPIESIFKKLPIIVVNDDIINRLRNGIKLNFWKIKKNNLFKIISKDTKKFVGIIDINKYGRANSIKLIK